MTRILGLWLAPGTSRRPCRGLFTRFSVLSEPRSAQLQVSGLCCGCPSRKSEEIVKVAWRDRLDSPHALRRSRWRQRHQNQAQRCDYKMRGRSLQTGPDGAGGSSLCACGNSDRPMVCARTFINRRAIASHLPYGFMLTNGLDAD